MRTCSIAIWLCWAGPTFAGETNAPAQLALADSGSSAALSFLRVLGGLGLVLALFFGGLWLYRNWERVAARRGRVTKLAICEARSLGQRHTLFVVGYEEQRMLVAASPTGVSLLTALPPAEPESTPAAVASPVSNELGFAGLLTQLLARKP
ncbi:MAG: flagellar biosynthetic protein FliO [Verrucomicrobiota bacterium]